MTMLTIIVDIEPKNPNEPMSCEFPIIYLGSHNNLCSQSLLVLLVLGDIIASIKNLIADINVIILMIIMTTKRLMFLNPDSYSSKSTQIVKYLFLHHFSNSDTA